MGFSLNRARVLININSNKKGNVMNVTGADDISDNATPTIFVSGDTEKLGLITGINLAASSMFGYNKSELLSIKILHEFPIFTHAPRGFSRE